ncbi:chaperone DNAJ protein [Trypanosoma theileri]|uniref:Chaperone DNAJ protein n=1 Tax=Trypanosoma theileri TaxID=67003 RepID=A0A1X0P609_9TRYP|nr:chaperone DNAJ protein [Trypanosoma theileri]ORC92288.1 chaperone DNAJ protein [Trypanosoma theileri]
MKRTLSKEQLADLAQQAVSSIRRFMSSSQDIMTVRQQDLLSTAKSIEECWQKKRLAADVSVVEMWVTGFQEELAFQLEFYGNNNSTGKSKSNSNNNGNNNNNSNNGNGNSNNNGNSNGHPSGNGAPSGHSSGDGSSQKKTPARKCIGESAMLTCTEVLKILMRTNGEKSVEIFIRLHLGTYMTRYLMCVPLSKKVREAFAAVLPEIIGYNELMLEECLSVSRGLLIPQERGGEITMVTPEQVHWACLLATIFRRVDVNNVPVDNARVQCGRSGFLSDLINTCTKLAHKEEEEGGGGGSGSCEKLGDGVQITAFIVYFGLITAMMRGCAANKTLCRSEHLEELTALWVKAASNVWRVEQTISIPTPTAGTDVIITVDGAQIWASDLVEFLVEIATNDSFSLRRQTLYEDSVNNGVSSSVLNANSSPPPTPSPLSSPGLSRTSRRYEPLPLHWDTILMGGSAHVWQLASFVFNCVISDDSCSFIAKALLCIDTQNTMSEFIFRSVISTLMLLCTARPQNAEVLAKSSILKALIARITFPQESVFPREVVISGKTYTATHAMNAYTVRLLFSFISLMSSLYVSEDTLPMLQYGLKEMSLRQTTQTDADIIETLLHVISCTGFPHGVLFFSGGSSVVCKVDRFPPTRFYGYSFAAWVYPKCVWLEGSHLFSYTDACSGSAVVLMIVANGRTCSLLFQIRNSTEVTLSLVPDTSFQADTWTHLAFTHSMTGFTIFINGRRTENSLTVPYPKSPSRKDRLQFAFGGCCNEPSFFGFVASIELFENTLSDKDIQRLYQAGPRPSRDVTSSYHPLLSVESQAVAGTKLLNVGVTGTLARKHEGVSVQSVVAFNPPKEREIFMREDVVRWTLRTLVEAKNSPLTFPIVARLCVQFICTAMKLTTTEEELNQMVDEHAIAHLREAVLAWENIPIEVPAVLIACAIPRNGGKVMRTHPTTQTILSLLLDVIGERGIMSSTVISCILRELSDTLQIPENVILFRGVPGRFEQILRISEQLPLECIDGLIILVERLCKEPREMEQTLQFLLSEPNSKTVDFVKAGLLHMLFDIARTNTAMCDLIGGAFGNCGVSFLIRLVGGKNHSSEVIRIFALRIISLMQHTNKKFRELFIKSYGYEVLAEVMTSPSSSSVPIRLPTFDCLFQMVFDAFQPSTEDTAVLSHLQQGCSSKVKRRLSKNQEQTTLSKGRLGQTLGLQGYLPGLVSQKLRVTRREYSFDFSLDFTYSTDTRLYLDDAHRCIRQQGSGVCALQVPQAIHTVLCLLERLLRGMSVGVGGNVSGGSNSRDAVISRESSTDANTGPSEDRFVNNMGDNLSTASAVSPTQEDSPESVSIRVLNHLEKIVDRPENGMMLLPFPWLNWLWYAVRDVFTPASNSGVDLPPKFPKKHASGIQQRTRNIIRSLAILDISHNSKANIVRIIRQTEQSPLLTRIVLEEIVYFFTKNRCVISNQSDAVNIIKNLDSLFHNIEDVLNPLPLALGLEIVNSISAIAVNNNSWVRMRMKNSSHLFETRKHLSFLLLSTIEGFHKLELGTIGQLLETNGHDANTVRLIFRRFVDAISNCDADEVETLLTMTRQLVNGDYNHYQVLLSMVGNEYRGFVDLCLRWTSRSTSSPLATDRPASNPSDLSARTEEKTNVDEPLVSEVIQWGREDHTRWESLKQRVCAATRSTEVVQEGPERNERERSVLAKVRRAEERRQAIQNKIAAEVERISREVDLHLATGAGAMGSSCSTTLSNNVKITATDSLTVSTMETVRSLTS